jgi:hypothetical protein
MHITIKNVLKIIKNKDTPSTPTIYLTFKNGDQGKEHKYCISNVKLSKLTYKKIETIKIILANHIENCLTATSLFKNNKTIIAKRFNNNKKAKILAEKKLAMSNILFKMFSNTKNKGKISYFIIFLSYGYSNLHIISQKHLTNLVN